MSSLENNQQHQNQTTKKPQPFLKANMGWLFYVFLALALVSAGSLYLYRKAASEEVISNVMLPPDDILLTNKRIKTGWKQNTMFAANGVTKKIAFDTTGMVGVLSYDISGLFYITTEGGANWSIGGYIGRSAEDARAAGAGAVVIHSLAADINAAENSLAIYAVVSDNNQTASRNNSFLYVGQRSLMHTDAPAAPPQWKWSILPLGSKNLSYAPTLPENKKPDFENIKAEIGTGTDEHAQSSDAQKPQEKENENLSNTVPPEEINTGEESDGASGDESDEDGFNGALDKSATVIPLGTNLIFQRKGADPLLWEITTLPKNSKDNFTYTPTMFLSEVAMDKTITAGFTTATGEVLYKSGAPDWRVTEPNPVKKKQTAFLSLDGGDLYNKTVLVYGTIGEERNFSGNISAFLKGYIYLRNFGTPASPAGEAAINPWIRSSINDEEVERIFDIHWLSKTTALMVGAVTLRGCIFRSDDGGQTFNLDFTSPNASFQQIGKGKKMLYALDLDGLIFEAPNLSQPNNTNGVK